MILVKRFITIRPLVQTLGLLEATETLTSYHKDLAPYQKKQEVMGRINSLLPFHTTRTALKTTPPTILRCRGDVLTEPLPSNERIHIQTHRLMGGIYEVRR
jgi:hypothetical protein